MSILTVYEARYSSVSTDGKLVEHEPYRSAVAISHTGTLTPGQTLTFSNGATAHLLGYNTSTKLLTFTLLTGEVTENLGATTSTGTLTGLKSFFAQGDEYRNLPGTHLWVSNDTEGTIEILAMAVGRCHHGMLHDQLVTITPSYSGIVAAFSDLARFNDRRTGRVKILYRGTTASNQVGVGAFRLS